MSHPSQFTLLRTRRFLPFFITQLLGAFNDNIFKQSLILAILYKLTIDGDRSIWVNLCALLFILPFFLFSALAGQFGEKFNKDALIRAIKIGEIVIMAVGATGFLFNHLELMLLALFAMGTHSALFGPVKYSIMPQALHEDELVGGNGLVEMGTFLAILAGTIGAGIMMSSTHYAPMVAVAIVGVAVLGYLASRSIPRAAASTPATAPELEYLQPVLGHPAHGPGADAGGVALDCRQLVVLVCRRDLPDADPGLRQGMVVRRRNRGDADPHGVLGGHRPRLDALRKTLRA